MSVREKKIASTQQWSEVRMEECFRDTLLVQRFTHNLAVYMFSVKG